MNTEAYGINVKTMGAAGDGVCNDQPAIQAALDAGAGRVVIPYGTYLLCAPLLVSSDTEIAAHPGARLVLADGALHGPDDFLLTNRHHGTGDANITVHGGIWDGNNPGNPRGELYDASSITGTMLHFRNVANLTLEHMTLSDPECYYICLCCVRDFRVEHISFETLHLRCNQDGVHLAGGCENGVIRHLRGTPGSPDDDCVAINADDCLTRLQNLATCNGSIRNILVEDIDCPLCHTFVRMGCVDSTIENIRIHGIRGGCKNYLLNLDATRYCRTPIVTPQDPRYFTGVGHVRGVDVSDVFVSSRTGKEPLIAIEEDVEDFSVRNVLVDRDRAALPEAPTLRIRNCRPTRITASGLTAAQARGILAEGCKVTLREEEDAFGNPQYTAQIDKPLLKTAEIPSGGACRLTFAPLPEACTDENCNEK